MIWLQKVLSYRFVQMPYTKTGQGQNYLKLACGHECYGRKTSVPIPKRARCPHGCNAPSAKEGQS